MTANAGNSTSAPTGAPRPAGPRLGIVGGGPLARLTTTAALQLGCDVVVLQPATGVPLPILAGHTVVGDSNDIEALRQLAARSDVVTLVNDGVDTAALGQLEDEGVTVLPRPRTVRALQDRQRQKEVLAEVGVPMARLCALNSLDDVAAAASELGLPMRLKARRKVAGINHAIVSTAHDFAPAWQQLGGDTDTELFAEAFCKFEYELATIVTRGRDGDSVVYPVAEIVRRDGVRHVVRVPAPVPRALASRAAELAQRAVAAVDGHGSFAVEMMLTIDGRSLVNQIVPRPHGSALYSLEACQCSQFENHVRAILGLPLGSPALVPQAAVQVHLFGAGAIVGLDRALTVPGAHIHVYGDRGEQTQAMGHVTMFGPSVAAAEDLARKCANAIASDA